MTADELARVAYLGLIAIAVGGWLMVEARRNISGTLKNLLVWSLIFLGVVGGYGLWEDVSQGVAPRQLVLDGGGRIEVPRAVDGHYYLSARVNGAVIDFVIDTGASDIVLTRADAEAAGIDTGALTYTGRANTANGIVATAPVRLDEVRLGAVADRGVRAVVNGGEMEESLLGMSYLERFGRLTIERGTLVLER